MHLGAVSRCLSSNGSNIGFLTESIRWAEPIDSGWIFVPPSNQDGHVSVAMLISKQFQWCRCWKSAPWGERQISHFLISQGQRHAWKVPSLGLKGVLVSFLLCSLVYFIHSFVYFNQTQNNKGRLRFAPSSPIVSTDVILLRDILFLPRKGGGGTWNKPSIFRVCVFHLPDLASPVFLSAGARLHSPLCGDLTLHCAVWAGSFSTLDHSRGIYLLIF